MTTSDRAFQRLHKSKKKLLVCKITTLKCLTSVSRKNPVGGYVSVNHRKDSGQDVGPQLEALCVRRASLHHGRMR